MAKWWGNFLVNILSGLVLLAIPAMVGYLAFLQDMPYFIIALAVIAAVGLVFFAITSDLLTRRHDFVGKYLTKASR